MTWTVVIRHLPAQAGVAFRGANSAAFLPTGPHGAEQWSGVYFGSTLDHSIGYLELANGVASLWSAALTQPLPVIFATGTSYGGDASGDDKATHLRQEILALGAPALGAVLPDTGSIMPDLGSVGYGYVGPDSTGTRELILPHTLLAQAPGLVNGALVAYVNRQHYDNVGWGPNPTPPFPWPRPANQTAFIHTLN